MALKYLEDHRTVIKNEEIVDEEETVCHWSGSCTFTRRSTKFLKILIFVNWYGGIIYAFGVIFLQIILINFFLYCIIKFIDMALTRSEIRKR